MKKVKALRNEYGFTQLQIAAKLEMKPSNYCNLENGKYNLKGRHGELGMYEDKEKIEKMFIDAIEAVRIDEINKLKNL